MYALKETEHICTPPSAAVRLYQWGILFKRKRFASDTWRVAVIGNKSPKEDTLLAPDTDNATPETVVLPVTHVVHMLTHHLKHCTYRACFIEGTTVAVM